MTTQIIDVKRIAGCPKCHWHDILLDASPHFNKLTSCCICKHTFPLNHDTAKSVLKRCFNCKTISQHSLKRHSTETVYGLSSDDDE